MADRECWRRFVQRLLDLDSSGHVGRMLQQQRPLVMDLLDDHHLSSFFWEDPGEIRAGKSRKSRFEARTWYVESRWGLILERVLERIYLLRCQLVHGAATHKGKLNRTSLDRSIRMMRQVIDALLLVMIDHGAEEDWGAMCYPPLE